MTRPKERKLAVSQTSVGVLVSPGTVWENTLIEVRKIPGVACQEFIG